MPRACPALRDARVAWAQTVRARTQRLAANATSEGGATYDELRDAYRRQPLGEDPLRRDAADRACWRDASRVATAARTLQDRVADLRSLLR